jgi:putative FmdB family regulatory protein
MPTYEYECQECGEVVEVEQSIAKELPSSQICPDCNGCCKRILTACNFQLKGDGWPSKTFRKGRDL